MLYRKDGGIYSRASAIVNILTQLDTVVQPAYIDDETLALYGFISDPDLTNTVSQTATQEQRKAALSSVDWVTGAAHLSEQTKAAVEAWRWIVRNLPQINVSADIPPLPKVNGIAGYFLPTLLTQSEADQIKNHVTQDEGWLTFLQIWKEFGFTYSKQTVTNLLTAYTNTELDEIISSL
jgi:hypothetical protein